MALKIPPPIWFVLSAVLMWLLARAWSWGSFVMPMGWIGLVLLLGVVVALLGVREFLRFKTTLNPLAPEQSRQIVQTGVFRYTRNPMYLGMALFLVAWALWLGEVLAFSGVCLFLFLITYLQVLPEERILQQKFGTEFSSYCQKVRRWI